MQSNEQTQAVLLLTAWFTKPDKAAPKPLSPSEWGRFALFMKERNLTPGDLLMASDPANCIEGWVDKRVTRDRIQGLLERSGALGIALEKWQRAGLWVMTRSDPDYPTRLKRRLKSEAPPVLFGAGERNLLAKGGVAVIGSRNIDDDELAYTNAIGREVAHQGYSVISGGARGADEAAMLGALEVEGTSVGVMADSLLRASSSSKYRQALMDRNLVLVSPFNPEAGFDVGNAMARNKYIYCLADTAIVIAATEGKGGTWTGAVENLKKGWVPLWVKPESGAPTGKTVLVDAGGHWLNQNQLDVAKLTGQLVAEVIQDRELLLPVQEEKPGSAMPTSEQKPEVLEANSTIDASTPTLEILEDLPKNDLPNSESQPDVSMIGTIAQPFEPDQVVFHKRNEELVEADEASKGPPGMPATLYECFLLMLEQEAQKSPLTSDVLQERLALEKKQLAEWLKRALAEDRVDKFTRPTRYLVKPPKFGF